MGLTGAAVGFNNALQRQLAERFAQQQAEQQYKDHLRQQQFENDMRVQQFQSNEELKHAQLDATTASQQGAEHDRQVGLASSLADQIPGGQFMAPNDPAVGMLQTGGRGSLLTPQDERPAVETGPLLPGDTGAAKAQGFIKTRSAKQIDTETDNERQAKAEADRQRHELAMEQAAANKPPHEPTPHFQLQPEVDPATGQQTGRFLGFNTLTNSWEPVKGQGPQGTKAAPGAADAAKESRTKSEALDTLSQLDRAIEDAKDLVGPGAGRFSNFEQMAGSADPRIQALGVKMKAAKVRVDHAVTGSVRAAASPQMMQQWDNILANKVTPEGLKAGVQAMREILGGGPSGGGPVRMTAPDGRSLQVPADKVAELERAGAKRVP